MDNVQLSKHALTSLWTYLVRTVLTCIDVSMIDENDCKQTLASLPCFGHTDIGQFWPQTDQRSDESTEGTRKVNKIVTVISRLILTARAIDVTNFPINMYYNDMTNTTTTGLVERSTSWIANIPWKVAEFESKTPSPISLFIKIFFEGEGVGMVNLLLLGTSDMTIEYIVILS